MLSSNFPADAATNVPLNTKIWAGFTTAMAPLSATTFTVTQGTTPVAGTVTTSADGTLATFSPSGALPASSVLTATITAGAKSAAGLGLAADKSWSFTSGSLADNSPPAVTSTSPAADSTGVDVGSAVSATFSKAMDPTTFTSTTFSVKQGSTPVVGSVAYGASNTATFTPAAALATSLVYTATLTTDIKDSGGGPLTSTFIWMFTAAPSPASAPTVSSTFPADAATGVALNAKLSAGFSTPMAALSATTFTLLQGGAPVTGTVATSADGMTATFAPATGLAANSVFTATISAKAKSAAGVSLGLDTSWSFTTGAAVDSSAPAVVSTNPLANATGVPINTKVAATFNKPMDPFSITSAAFTLKQGITPVAGSLVYGPGTTATFTPTNPLAGNTSFTATVTTDVKDLAGNSLASTFMWTFMTSNVVAKGPAPVLLGTAGNYVVLAKTAISTVPASAITGDIGVSPAAATYITGFSLVADPTNVFSTSTPQLTGKAFAADYAVPTPINLTTAVGNMQSAYTDAAGRPTPDFLELGTGNIGTKTLAPGLYKWTSAVTVPADVTISGGANDVWIFQTTGDLSMSANQHVLLAGGAQAKNIFWQVAGKVTFGAGAHFEGVLLCKTQVTLQTGSTMNGRILAQTQVALQQATVVQPTQ